MTEPVNRPFDPRVIPYASTQLQQERLQAWLDYGSQNKAAEALGCDRKAFHRALRSAESNYYETHLDQEIVAENVKLAKRAQRHQDVSRIERKAFREQARIENAVGGYVKQMCELLDEHGWTEPTAKPETDASDAVGVIQLTDIHFNEMVDLAQNQYNFEIAGKRLYKLVSEASREFRMRGIRNVLVALTGDLMNSDRRLDELLINQDNRARATLGAVDILRQLFWHLLNDGFNITAADVNGNEGRVPKDVGWVDKVASDNYDETICRMLQYSLKDVDRVSWATRADATECVVSVAGHNWLLIHGHQIGKNTETEIAKLVAKYAKRGIEIRYVIFGHIHSGHLNENYARSPSPVGDNAYSDKALNLTGRAGGAYYIAEPSGAIHARLQDTQDISDVEGYTPIEAYRAHNPKSAVKADGPGTTIFQVVV